MNETATIIPLSAVEPAMVETLLDRVFGDDRHARTAYRIRAGMAPLEAMSFAVLDEAELLVGTSRSVYVDPVSSSSMLESSRVSL